MLETLRNVWKVAELRKKIFYTIGMLLVYRLLCYIPTPGVDTSGIADALNRYSLLNFMNSMTGSDLGNYTIMAMGITPYINASIIMQLLCLAIPRLEQLNKEEGGREKIANITRYVTVGLGFMQAVALTIGLKASASGGFMNVLTIGFCLAAGTALAMWIGERITAKGIGNGVSLLIFAGIIANFAIALSGGVVNTYVYIVNGMWLNVLGVLAVLIVSLALIVGVVLVEQSERRIPIQYAKRMVGRKMYGGQSTHIPLRLNASGVLPLIFASAIMQFPGTILAFFPNSAAYAWWNTNVSPSNALYMVVFALLILGFTFFYSSITFNPVEMAKQIQQNGGAIPGIRQGKPMSDHISKISKRITLFGAIFLAFLALLPSIVYALANVSLPFAASSLLIAVSVAVESMRQLEGEMTLRHYKGFLK